MIRTILSSCAIIYLLITLAVASDIPFIAEQSIRDLSNIQPPDLERISSKSTNFSDYPVIYVPNYNEIVSIKKKLDEYPRTMVSRTITDLEEIFDARIEPKNQYVRHKAQVISARYPGDHIR